MRRASLYSVVGFVILCIGAICGVLFHCDHFLPYVPLHRFFASGTDPWDAPSYRMRLAFERFPQHGRVLMLGDSLTEGGDWSAIEPIVGPTVNQGVTGDTTAGILRRVDLAISTKAQTVAVMAGINDLYRGEPVERVFDRYQQLIEKLRAPGRCIIVQSTLLTRRGEPLNNSVRALNRDLAAICDGSRCRFLDLNAVLAPEGVLQPEFTVDGIHLAKRGYDLWRALLVPVLADCATNASR